MLDSSVLAQVLRQAGDSRTDFLNRLHGFYIKKPEAYDRFHGIRSRIKLVENLSEIRELWIADHEAARVQYEIERLCTYLAIACIDASESDKGFVTFPVWLRRQLRDESPLKNVQTAVECLTTASTDHEISRALRESLPNLELDYRREQGIRQGFYRFFSQLPQSVRTWLCSTYLLIPTKEDCISVLVKGAGDGLSVEDYWAGLSDQERLDTIADYLYGIRNTHTHTVARIETVEWGRGPILHWTIRGEDWGFREARFRDKDWCVGSPANRPESKIVRLLVVGALRKSLGFDDSDELVSNFWAASELRSLAIHACQEAHENGELVVLLTAIAAGVVRLPYREIIPRLRDENAEKLDRALERRPDTSQSLRQYLREYLHDLRHVNEVLESVEHAAGERLHSEGIDLHTRRLQALRDLLLQEPGRTHASLLNLSIELLNKVLLGQLEGGWLS
jgi:hypothetical protein